MNTVLAVLAALAVGNLALLGMVFRQGALLRRLRRDYDALSRGTDALQRDVDALCTGAGGMDGHLARIEQQVKRLFERQDQIELRETLHREYDHAVRLIRGGADIATVMTECNLVRTEAELLLRLHGGRGTRSSQPPLAAVGARRR